MIPRGLLHDRHVELIHGAILPMAPVGPPHSNALDLLNELLVVRLVGRARVRCQLAFIGSDDSEPQPDIAVVPLGNYATAHPSRAFLLVEVADSSLAFDRETKGPLYAASDVDAHWVVDVAARAIEVSEVPNDGRFTSTRRVEMGDALVVAAFPDVEVAVAALFRA